MNYSEKLNYLFQLTRAEGKELAAAMNITPPQISKMRNGVRGLPKNREAAYTLAQFFAKRCDSISHKDALSKTLRLAQIRNIDSVSALSDILLNWLMDGQNNGNYGARQTEDFLLRFNAAPETVAGSVPSEEMRRVLHSSDTSVFAYYGSEGKRLAVMTYLQYLQHQKKAYTVNILTDEDIGWIIDEPSYSQQLYSAMLRLTEQGCVFRRIAGPISDMDQAFESLNRWFPLYLTGKATSYRYKRMRDNLGRVTIFVVPDVAVMFSFSVGNQPQSDAVTFFTTDEKTVHAMAVEFENYMAMCEPIMNVHTTDSSVQRLHECMLDYESCKSSSLQRCNTLSFITLPWDVAVSLEADERPEDKNVFLTSLAQRYKRFKTNLEHYDFTDIMRLADIEDVMSEIVPIPASCSLGEKTQYYTVAGYLQHLRSILYLLEHRPHYHVVLQRGPDVDPSIIHVKEGYTALLVRDVQPFAVFEVSERYLVDAFAESLRRLAPSSHNAPAERRAAIADIRALITEIERRSGEESD